MEKEEFSMDINAAAIKDVFKQGHAEAWAKAEMPSLEINELISFVASVLGAKENQKEAAVAAAKQLFTLPSALS